MPTPPRPAAAPAGLAAAAVLLLTALAGLAAHGGSYARELPSAPAATTAAPTSSAPPPPIAAAATTSRTGDLSPALTTPAAVWFLLLCLLFVAGVVVLVWTFVVNRPRRRLERAPEPAVDEGVAAAIPEAVERALAAVEQPDAREAVVRAWLLLGAAAATAGTPARPAETATEYGDRVAAAHGLPAPAVHRLAALYREARFSGHPVGPAQRDAARTELTALQTALRSGRVS